MSGLTMTVILGSDWRLSALARLAPLLVWLPLPCFAWLFRWAVRGLRYRIGDGRWRPLGYTGHCRLDLSVREAR